MVLARKTAHRVNPGFEFTFRNLRSIAEEMIRIGTRLRARQYRATARLVGRKLVSDADVYAERSIVRALKKIAPHAAFFAEEGWTTLPHMQSEVLVFVIDPIDGTRFYLAGRDDWAMTVGIYSYGELLASIVLQPGVRECFIALSGAGIEIKKGRGAWRGHVRKRAAQQLVGVSTSLSVAENPERWIDAGLLTIQIANTFSAPTVVSILEIIRGRASACVLLYLPKLWDIAGPLLLVQEIDGVYMSIDGEQPKLDDDTMPYLIFAESLAKAAEIRWHISREKRSI